MLRDEMRCLHPLADVTDHRARTRLQNLVQRVAHHEDVEDAESGARAEVRLKSITMLSSFIIGFDLPGSSQRDLEAAKIGMFVSLLYSSPTRVEAAR